MRGCLSRLRQAPAWGFEGPLTSQGEDGFPQWNYGEARQALTPQLGRPHGSSEAAWEVSGRAVGSHPQRTVP